MKKLKVKKIVVLVIAIMTVSSAMLISCGALDFHRDNYNYTLTDGWQDDAFLEHHTATGVLTCRYTNGPLSVPKTETTVIRGSQIVLQCGVYSQINLTNGKEEHNDNTGAYSASLELKAGTIFNSVSSTIQFGFVNDGTYVAEGQFNGSN